MEHTQELKQEQQRLDHVMDVLSKEKQSVTGDASRFKNEVIHTRKHFWDEVCINTDSFDDHLDTIIGLRQEAQTLAVGQSMYGHSSKRIATLERMQKTPYFGRIDFTEAGTDTTEAIYVGISTLRDESGEDFLIYDWRAPISSIYYDHQPGPASYKIPGDVIEGTLEKKWQFVIRNGQVEAMFDTGLTIGDEILQQVLGQGTDKKMHSIVATIQQEQNQIVRHHQGRVLVVHGTAGSGKTSVAMQRIAYLLYHYRDSLKSDQIVLFSPNAMFNSYVSNVLPELGEENMYQVTFQQYLIERLSELFEIETPFNQLEFVFTQSQHPDYDARIAGIEWKASTEFLEAMTAYVKGLEDEGLQFVDLRFRGEVVVHAEEIQRQFYAQNLSGNLLGRLEKLQEWMRKEVKHAMKGEWQKDWVQEKMDLLSNTQYHKAHQHLAKKAGYTRSTSDEYDMTPQALALLLVRQQLKPLSKQIQDFSFIDTEKLYRQLFETEHAMTQWASRELPGEWPGIRQQTLAAIDEGKLLYEDATPYLFLQQLLLGFESNRAIKHVVIDEAQDYSPFQFEFIKRMFPSARLTILGDFNQAIFAHARQTDDFNQVLDLYGPEETTIYYLAQSYRSTKPIVDFTRKLVPNGDAIIPFDRDGLPPEMNVVETHDELHFQIREKVAKLKKDGHKSIAIICKSALESQQAFSALSDIPNLKLMTTKTTEYEQGVVVIPSYLSKGIEFEAVVVYNASQEVYEDERLRRTFYTVCTRAMHELHLYSVGQPTKFVEGVL